MKVYSMYLSLHFISTFYTLYNIVWTENKKNIKVKNKKEKNPTIYYVYKSSYDVTAPCTPLQYTTREKSGTLPTLFLNSYKFVIYSDW